MNSFIDYGVEVLGSRNKLNQEKKGGILKIQIKY